MARGRTGFQVLVIISETSSSVSAFLWHELSSVDINGSCLHGGQPLGSAPEHTNLGRALEKNAKPSSQVGLELL